MSNLSKLLLTVLLSSFISSTTEQLSVNDYDYVELNYIMVRFNDDSKVYGIVSDTLVG